MGLRTLIQWCDSTGNLEMGCDGCELWIPEKGIKICYAGKLTELHAGQPGWPESFDKPTLFPERLKQIVRWRDLRGTVRPEKPWIPPELPRLIFLDDVGDTFSESLPLDWLAPHLPAMAASAHIYILLTKRPARMRDFFSRHPVPRNFWLLASITNRASLARTGPLFEIDAPVLGVSIEPAWQAIDLRAVPGIERCGWVIVGGESGVDATPCDIDWLARIVDACAALRVPLFVKQLGSRLLRGGRPFMPLSIRDGHGGDWNEWGPAGLAGLRIREFPHHE